MGRHIAFRSNNINGSTGKHWAGREVARRDSGPRVSTEAQRVVRSFTGRAARVGGNGKGGPKSGTAR